MILEREPCVPVPEQGNDLMEHRTCYREYVPPAPPPSPSKLTPITCAGPTQACPSSFCALHIVDRQIEAHQSRLSPVRYRRSPAQYSPPLLNDNVSGKELKCSDQSMPRMVPMRQVSSASDDGDVTATTSSRHSSRSTGVNSFWNVPPSDREDSSHPTAIRVHNQQEIATLPQSGTQPSSQRSPSFSFLNLRSCREAVADAPSKFRLPSHGSHASGSRTTVTGKHISSPRPIGSSIIPDIAALPLEYGQSKTESWQGLNSRLPGPDTVGKHETITMTNPCKCDFACAYCRDCRARCEYGMPRCAKCLSRNETCSSNKYFVGLQPLAENAREKEAMDEGQTVVMEEEHSRFSDSSADEDEDGGKVPSNIRLFNSLGRRSQRSKTRLSWGNLFSKS